jgi:hypothetical protein
MWILSFFLFWRCPFLFLSAITVLSQLKYQSWNRKLYPSYHKINIRILGLVTGELRNFVRLFVLSEIKFGRLGKMQRKKTEFHGARHSLDELMLPQRTRKLVVMILDSAGVHFHSYSHVFITTQKTSLAFSCLFFKCLLR